MLLDWSPTWDTHPQITSSMMSTEIPVRSSSSLRTMADRSAGCTPDNPPLRFPTAVRTAPTMTTSRILLLRLRWLGTNLNGRRSVAPGQFQDMRSEEVQDHLLADRRDLHQPGLAEVARDVLLLRVTHAAVGL